MVLLWQSDNLAFAKFIYFGYFWLKVTMSHLLIQSHLTWENGNFVKWHCGKKEVYRSHKNAMMKHQFFDTFHLLFLRGDGKLFPKILSRCFFFWTSQWYFSQFGSRQVHLLSNICKWLGNFCKFSWEVIFGKLWKICDLCNRQSFAQPLNTYRVMKLLFIRS